MTIKEVINDLKPHDVNMNTNIIGFKKIDGKIVFEIEQVEKPVKKKIKEL